MTDYQMPRNKKDRPFTWSFSAMQQFENCPYQYAAERFYCTTAREDTEATLWGTRVHTALEERIRDKKPLAGEYEQYERYAKAIESLGGEVRCEQQVALTRELKPVAWGDPQAWVRGIFDVAVKKDDTLILLDYKTGKVRPNSLQLKMFVALASTVYSDVKTYRTRYIWLKHQHTTSEDYTADDVDNIWAVLLDKAERMEEAWRTEVFNCNPSGLCGWCSVTECLHYRERKQRR